MAIRLEDLPLRAQQQAVAKLQQEQLRRLKKPEPKYHNEETEHLGIRFDSRKEARRFEVLLSRLNAGEIRKLRLQQDFTLQEAYRDGEELVHGCCGHCTFDGSCDHPAPAGETGCKPEGVAVEMIDCIIRILDWCGKMGVDVDGVLAMKHAYNKGRPYRHGGKAL